MLLTTLILSSTLAQDAAAAEVVYTPDIVYATRPSGELKLDIASPSSGDGPFPTIIAIHGGAWRGGNRTHMRPFMESLAKRGYVVVSPQYRLCPQEIFPAQVLDVKEAVRWVRTHAKDHKVDPERLGAMGGSAGGHLALMLGVTDRDDGLEGDAAPDAPSTRVKAVVNYFGPTDLAATDLPDVSKPLVKDFLGGTPAEKPELCAQASPLTHVTSDDAPILTFQGTRDPLVPHSQAIKLVEKMSEVGVPGRVELLIGAGHGWGDPEMKRTLDMTAEFFALHLKANSK